MKKIASTEVSGPEAKGPVIINLLDSGRHELVLSDFWVAPGAPDVWVAISPETDGQPKADTINLVSYDYDEDVHRILLDEHIAIDEVKTVIIYCKKFNVHFGHGILKFESD